MPQIVTYVIVEVQRRTKVAHDTSTTAAVVGEEVRIAWDKSNIEQ